MLCGATDADESPLEPGVYLIPAGCVATEPPTTWGEDKWPRWNGQAWDLVVRPTYAAPNDNDPVAKLRAFLASNPDVDAVLKQGSL